MGMESFSNSGPTKESLQARIEDLQRQREVYSKRLQEAQDTPTGALFSEGEKRAAIENHQAMLDGINPEIEEVTQKLSGLNS